MVSVPVSAPLRILLLAALNFRTNLASLNGVVEWAPAAP